MEVIGKEDKDVEKEEERVIEVGSMRLDNYEVSEEDWGRRKGSRENTY